MKIFLAIKAEDNPNHEHIRNLIFLLEEIGFEITCVLRDIEKWGQIKLSPRELMKVIGKEIISSDIIVIDTVTEGSGLVEAGFAYAKEKTIATIVKQGNNIPKELYLISSKVLFYKEYDELVYFFKKHKSQGALAR